MLHFTEINEQKILKRHTLTLKPARTHTHTHKLELELEQQ